MTIGAADDVRVAAELRLPQVVAEHDDARPGRLFGCKKPTSEKRWNAEDIEELPRDDLTIQLHRQIAPGQRHAEIPVAGEVLENIGAAKLEEREIGERLSMRGTAHAHRLDGDEGCRLMKGQRPEDDRIDDAEDRTVGADTDGQREDRRGSKRRGAAKLTDRVTDVAREIVGQSPSPHVATLLADARDVAERAVRRGDGVGAREAGGHQRIDFLVEVKRDLVGEVAIHAVAREQAADPAQGAHGFTGVNTSLIPSSICSKLETSRSRCFRPAGVSW